MQAHRDDHPVAGIDEFVWMRAEVLDQLVEEPEHLANAVVPPIDARRARERGGHVPFDLRVEELEDALHAALLERLVPAPDDVDVVAAHAGEYCSETRARAQLRAGLTCA